MAGIDAMKILGSLLSSGALSRGSGSNVLGSVIGAVTGGSGGGGGLGGLVGSMLGGGGSQGSGAADLLGGLLGGSSSGAGGGLGSLLGMAMQQFGGAQRGGAGQARAAMNDDIGYAQAGQQAEVLIRAMIIAAKADGRVDAEEQQKIVDRLGEVSDDELAFVKRELASPLDVQAFARSIPRGMEQQVYAMSLMAIDLDTNPEAQYLHQLAQATGIDAAVANQIHEQLGAPTLYR